MTSENTPFLFRLGTVEAKGTAFANASVCWSNRNEATEATTGKGEGVGGEGMRSKVGGWS